MKAYEIVLGAAAILLCTALSVVVLVQKKAGKGLSGAVFGASEQMRENIKGANTLTNRIAAGCLAGLAVVALAMNILS